MDKISFASYKFKPSDVIEGLNRYFAEAKANRYLRVQLEIRSGVCWNNPDCVKDVVFTNSPPDRHTMSGHVCWKYYLICDPEEVVGVAINWLREEHGIFYRPGMNEPPIKDPDDIFCMENLKETKNFSITIDDFCVDDATKEYEKATRKDLVPIAEVREALGIAEDSDIFQCIKYRNNQLETLRTELAVARRLCHKAAEQQKKIDSYESTLSKITDIMEPKHEGPAWSETWDDLVERIKRMKEKVETLEAAKTDWRDSFDKSQDSRSAFCKKLKEELNVDYRYPGCFPKMEEDILWEIKRLKTEHDDVRGLSPQLQWAQKENLEWLKRYEQLKSELNEMKRLYCGMEKVKKLEQKLAEIQDICER